MAGPSVAPDDDRTPYQGRGVAGGKLKSRGAAGSSAVRRSIPYGRPSQGRHASAGPQAAAHLTRVGASRQIQPKGSWLGGSIVSSASKILTKGAAYVFSSLFGNPGIATTSENATNGANCVVEEEPRRQLDVPKQSAEADGLNFEKEKTPTDDGDGDAQEELQFKEMEYLLKHNTLTREQCNHFIEVLKAKVQGSDVVNIEAVMPRSVEQSQRALARIEAVRASSTSHPDPQRWREERQRYRQEKAIVGKNRLIEQGGVKDYLFVEDGELPSPRGIAKKYMDIRLSRASGSTFPQSPLKDEGHLSPLHFTPRSSQAQGPVDGRLQKNKKPTSAEILQSVSRTYSTPYGPPNNFQPPGEGQVYHQSLGLNLGMETEPKSGFSWTPFQTPITGGREMLKRRRMVLEDVGTLATPIRRTRIRTSMTSQGILGSANMLGPRPSANVTEPPVSTQASSSMCRLTAFGFEREKVPCGNHMTAKKDEMNSLAFVPIQSSRTAQMILETLERMSPSPKGKSVDGELALLRERPPTRLSPTMLNKRAQRTMQTIEPLAPPSDSLEASEAEDLRNIPSFIEPFSHPSEPSMQSIKGKEILQSPSADNVPTTSFGNKANEANGFELKSKHTSLGMSNAPENIVSKLPDVAVSKQSKSKGFQMNADFEELFSDDEGQESVQAIVINSKLENSAVLATSGISTFCVSSTTSSEANLPVTSVVPTIVNTLIPPLEAQTSSSSGVAITLSEASPKFTSGFTFPVSSFSGPKLEPPTPKPMPLPSSQIEKSSAVSAPLLQDTNVSSPLTTPGFAISSSLFVEKSDSKKGFFFPTTGISQGQVGTKQTIDVSNFNVAGASSFEKTQSSSATTSSGFVPKSSPIMGSSTSLQSASAFGSLYSAPSLPSSFSFGGASFSSGTVSASSSTTASTTIMSPICSAATGNVFSAPVSPFTATSTPATSGIFSASPTLPNTSSVDSSIASQPKATFGLGGAGQGASSSSQQSTSTIGTPIFGSSVSVSSTNSASFVFGNSASSVNMTTALAPSLSTPSSLFGSAVSSTSSIFGTGSTSLFGLANAGSAFGGDTVSPITSASIPSFGMTSGKSFGNFGQDVGSRSFPADNTFGSTRVLAPTSVGFGLTPSSALSTQSFSYSSTGVSAPTTFTFGTSSSAMGNPFFGAKSPTFQPPLVFGSAITMPPFGTPTAPTVSVVPNDSNEQTIMEDNMSDEPAQITPTGLSPMSSFGTPPPQTAPFTFGAPNNNASSVGPAFLTFGGQPTPPSIPTPGVSSFGDTLQNQFGQPGQSLGSSNPFSGGFSLGSGGEKPRKHFKAKRTVAKRGK